MNYWPDSALFSFFLIYNLPLQDLSRSTYGHRDIHVALKAPFIGYPLACITDVIDVCLWMTNYSASRETRWTQWKYTTMPGLKPWFVNGCALG
jgi:hypothetical protein